MMHWSMVFESFRFFHLLRSGKGRWSWSSATVTSIDSAMNLIGSSFKVSLPLNAVLAIFYSLFFVSGFINYYRDNFAGKSVVRNGVLMVEEPRFATADWNCWAATLEGRVRTNNYNEGKNRANKRQFYKGARPKLSFCIRIDRKEEDRLRNVYTM
jgi:hypothetical protein